MKAIFNVDRLTEACRAAGGANDPLKSIHASVWNSI